MQIPQAKSGIYTQSLIPELHTRHHLALMSLTMYAILSSISLYTLVRSVQGVQI